MSCGGHILSGFSCGSKRFDKYKFTVEKPSNPVLHTENQQKLNEMLRLREEQDKGIFQPISLPTVSPTISHTVSPIIPIVNNVSQNYYPTSDVLYKCKKD
jgi:hypothetical protein